MRIPSARKRRTESARGHDSSLDLVNTWSSVDDRVEVDAGIFGGELRVDVEVRGEI